MERMAEAILQTVETASQSFLRKQKKESKSFSAGACTWQKILLRLQVWELCAVGAQGVRAADCKNLAESPEGDFRHAEGWRKPSFLFCQSLQRGFIQDLHSAPGQLHHALALEIPQHPGNHLPGSAHVVGDFFVGDL